MASQVDRCSEQQCERLVPNPQLVESVVGASNLRKLVEVSE